MGKPYTFGELQKAAECLAGHLLDLGLKPRDVITFYSTNCLEYIVMLLAVWRVGGTVALLNAMALASKIISVANYSTYHGIYCACYNCYYKMTFPKLSNIL